MSVLIMDLGNLSCEPPKRGFRFDSVGKMDSQVLETQSLA